MTFDERVRALAPLGFSERQTRFLVTVALHSGFCLRRHYAAFAGLQAGAGVRSFLDRLVARGLARRSLFRPDRGHVYHVHHSGIYNAIGQDDNRNRRRTSPALVARKLMLLDYVLEKPSAEWYATEQDKVELFTTRFGVPTWDLPQRHYLGWDRAAIPLSTTRYFVHKLPICLSPVEPAVGFVFLVTDTSGQAFAQFLRDHRRLLSHIPAWRIAAVAPVHIPGLAACEGSFRQVTTECDPPFAVDEVDNLRSCFRLYPRLANADDDLADVTVAHMNHFRETRKRLSPQGFEDLFQRWRHVGDAAFEDASAEALRTALADGRGALVTYRLPVRYDRFGSRAGVA